MGSRKPLNKWTKAELIAEIERLRSGAPQSPIEQFSNKQAVLVELVRLYNEPGVPWNKRVEILKLIAQEEHGMFSKQQKGGGNDYEEIFRRLETSQLQEA